MSNKKIKKIAQADAGLPRCLVLYPTRPQSKRLTAVNVSQRFVGETIKSRWQAKVISAMYLLIVLLSYSTISQADSQPAQQQYQINVPQLNAADALNRLAEQTGVTFLFPYELAQAQQANPVAGRFTLMEALSLLLKDSALSGGLTESGVVIISRKKTGENLEGMGMNSKKKLLASTIAFFVGGSSSGVVGQESVPEKADGFMLEEIVITASRREKSLNETAVSVAAIGAQDIERRNLSEMNDYLRIIPGVSMNDQGVGRNAVVIRGLTIDPELEASAAGVTVGIYFDEISLAGLSSLGGSSDIRMIDLERVEVLRGPQGTLFGAGALGGAVRNISNAPKLDLLGGSVKTEYSETADEGGSNTKFEGVLNVPVIEDELALRVVAYRHDNDGYIKNIAGTQLANNGPAAPTYDIAEAVALHGGASLYQNQSGIGDVAYEGGRVSLLWEPVEDFSVNLSYLSQDVDQKGQPYIQQNTGGYTQVALQGGVAGKGEGLKDKINITSLNIEYDLGWASLLSVSGWLNNDSGFDYDITALLSGLPSIQFIEIDTEVFTQEFRLVSGGDGPFNYILGIYYEDNEADRTGITYATGELIDNVFGTPFDYANPQIAFNNIQSEIDQLSVYGEISYDITDTIELSLGARRFDYERERLTIEEGAFGNQIVEADADESGTTSKANISYTPNDDLLVYAQWSEGFRFGGVNDVPSSTLCDVNNDGVLDGTNAPIKPGIDSDTTENFELGMKLSAIDNRLQVNAAVYRIDWEGIPLRVQSGKLPEQESQICFTGITFNAAEAESEGFEIETQYQVTSALSIGLGGGYTSVELAEDSLELGASAGDRLSGTPEYTGNFNIQYEFELGGYASYIRSEYLYVSEFYSEIGEKGTEGGDYGQWGLSSGITMNQFNIDIFGHNLTNEDALTLVSGTFADTRAWRLKPRTIGMSVTYQF